MKRLAYAALACVALPAPARAYRPFNSTDAAVAGRGEIELEVGPAGFLEEGSDRWLVAPALILNWGFARDWEAVLEARHLIRLGAVGSGRRLSVEDAALSLKTVLRDGVLQEGSGVSVASELSALLPSVDGETGAGLEGAVIVSQRWEAVTLHLNGAAAWTRAHVPGFFTGLIAEGHDAWAIRPVAEVFVEGERDVPTTFSGLAGAIWRVRDNLSVDAGLRLARAGDVSIMEIRAGFTWAFALGWPTLRRKR